MTRVDKSEIMQPALLAELSQLPVCLNGSSGCSMEDCSEFQTCRELVRGKLTRLLAQSIRQFNEEYKLIGLMPISRSVRNQHAERHNKFLEELNLAIVYLSENKNHHVIFQSLAKLSALYRRHRECSGPELDKRIQDHMNNKAPDSFS